MVKNNTAQFWFYKTVIDVYGKGSNVRNPLKLIKIGNYSQTQQLFIIIKGDNVSALLLSHHQACAVS
jgi:hypothetical protein